MRLYFAIGQASDNRVALFKKENVRRVLISYASVAGESEISIPFEDVMIDSGAFGVETGVSKVNLKGYTLWLQLYLDKYPQIKTCVNLDILSDPDKSMRNLEYMESEGLHPMPVYHYGEETEVLDKLCSKYEYVGIGGMAVGTMANTNLQKFWEFVCDRYLDNKFHVFGVGTMTPFFRKQPFSLDCTSWNVGARFGDLMGYRGGLPFRWSAREMYGMKFFFTTEELFSNNIRAMLDWEKLEWTKSVEVEEGDQGRLL